MAVVVNRDGKTIVVEKGSISAPVDSLMPAKPGTRAFTHTWFVSLEPGLYQVRVAARDPNSGLAGSDHQWIDLPRIDATQPVRKIQLGSVFVRAGKEAGSAFDASAYDFDLFTAERRFTSDSRLYFLSQVYNETSYPVDVDIKVYLGNRLVIHNAITMEKPASSGAGLNRITGNLPLAQLAPGAYVLEVTATDRSTRASAARQVSFLVARQ